MNAVVIRRVMVALLAIFVAAIMGLAWLGIDFITKAAVEADHKQTDAEVSATELQQLKKLENDLTTKEDLIDKVHSIVTTKDQYQYQDQIINDVTSYADYYGFGINNFDFSTSAKATSSEKTPFRITLDDQVDYRTFLLFINALETNLTKIQVTSLSLTPAKDPTYINNPTVSLEVYIKK